MKDPLSEFLRGGKSDGPQTKRDEGASDLTLPKDLGDYLPPALWRKLENDTENRKLLLRANDQLRSLLYLISTYLPGNLVQEKRKRPVAGLVTGRTLNGSLLFADVSGFTALSERLAVLGLEGAERLTAIMNGYFEAMLEILAWSGGTLLKFAGDATLVYFPEQRRNRQAQWAVRAGMRMLRAISDFAYIETPTEIVSLKMKIGVATGKFLAASVGSAKRMEYAVLGEAISQTMASEGAATGAGQLIINAATAEAIGEAFQVQDQAPGFYAVELQDEQISDFEIKAERRRARGAIPWDTDPAAIVEQMRVTLDQIKALRPYLASELVERVITHAKRRRFESEFRLTVVMFCNFTGPEKLLALWGNRSTRRVTNILSDYFNAMSDVITRYGGIITRIDPYSKGTKLLALFGAPVSHQDDPLRAARAALQMNIELESINQRWQKKFARHLPQDWEGALIQHRIGLTLGETFAGQVGSSTRREYTVMGDDVNLSARLMGAARPGQILLSKPVFDKVTDFFFLTQLSPIKVKGKSKPIPIYQLDGPRADTLRHRINQRGPLIGRADEMAQAQALLEQALEGTCQRLIIQGPAGIGKSHLADVLLKRALQQGAQVLSYQANSYNAEVPYSGWSGLLRALAGITSTDPLLLHREKLQRLMRAFELPGQFMAPLGTLMGIDLVDQQPEAVDREPEEHRDLFQDIIEKKPVRRRARRSDLLGQLQKRDAQESRTGFYILSSFSQDQKELLLHAIVSLLKQVSQKKPLAIFFEDAHWLDSASCGLLSQIQAALQDAPVFILLAQRGEPDRFSGGEILNLEPLPEAGTRELVAHILISDLTQIIQQQSSGNPLFVNEITHWIRETWNISTQDVKKALQSSDFLRNLVFSNLESLSESQREIARVSSVVGNQFRLGELKALLSADVDAVTLHHDLRGLVSARLIALKSAGVDAQYAFEQKLVRDILYNSLPYARRRELHAQLADYLDAPPDRRGQAQAKIALFLDPAASNPAGQARRIARHYELAEKWLSAAQHWARAADFVAEQGDYQEAATTYDQALFNLEKVSSQDKKTSNLRQGLYAKRGDMAVFCADYAGAERAYQAALAIDGQEHPADLKRKLALILPVLGQADAAQALIREVLEQDGQARELAAVVTLTWLLWRQADEQTAAWVEKARALLPEKSDPWAEQIEILLHDLEARWEAVISAYRMLEQPRAAAFASLRLGDRYLDEGKKEKTLKQYKRAARIFEKMGDQDCGLALVHYRQAEVCWQTEDPKAARTHLESAQSLLLACPLSIQKEGREIFVAALKILNEGRPSAWPKWRWQQFDDEIKIAILFRP